MRFLLILEEFLSVTSDLGTGPSGNTLLDFLPILSIFF